MWSLFNFPLRPFVIVDSARSRFHSSVAIARDDDEEPDRVRARSFALMCLQWLLRFAGVTVGRAFVSRIHAVIGVIGG